MPPSDQEPRYQLVDSNGNVVGSLFGDGSGNVVIADETDTQTTFDADGITTPALEAGEARIGTTGPIREVGTVDHGSVGGGGTINNITVSFQRSYNSPPTVIHTYASTQSLTAPPKVEIHAQEIDTNGFKSQIENNGSGAETFDKCGFWVIE